MMYGYLKGELIMASIPSNYEINVVQKYNAKDKNGIHFCKIQLKSDVYLDEQAEEQLRFFRELFGDMYHVSMTHWKCHGEMKEGWD